MADVSLFRRDGREDADSVEDRAQIILITGLTLAVLFVAVVLLLNTVIYTENLATRGADAGGAEAIEFRDGVTEDLIEIMYREHRNASTGDVGDEFDARVATYARTVADLRARDGVIADVTVTGTKPGTLIFQNETSTGLRNMTNRSGTTPDWTVASDINQTRDYQLTVDSTRVSNDESGAFAVVTERPGANWSVTLSNDAPDAINVTVSNGTGNGTTNVSKRFPHETGANVTIDLTAGTVDGDRFSQLVWAEGVQNGNDTYDIRYRNGDEAFGTYSFVIDDPDDTASDWSSRPYVADALYRVNVEIRHRTPELTYGEEVRLAPGERDA
ncbi:hypothetical protein EXE41_14700 [Halorubrum sp. SD690R]|uniref:DUF7261 family protein n=1 Tax=Halorubrum sp. SD690R TaxID=2518117 RepID=UPI0010F4D028|nr:hypothetical protein [Halorubrum sp. SD690R]TKX43808.1 hypothetical protein EXE41_14700 [Halorubrum sp. SD690R]